MDRISVDWRKSTYSGANGATCVEVGTWRKSTHSGSGGGTCVEVAAWRKSTHSGAHGGTCVEVGSGAPSVLVRDTTDHAGAVLAIPAASWRAFLTSIRA